MAFAPISISFALLLSLAIPTFVGAQSQQEMNQEAARDAAAADKELNAVYQKVMATLDEEGQALLKASQRAWLAFRDAEAAFAADEMRGGSAAPLLQAGSMTRSTKDRIRRLRECLGGNAEEAKPAARKAEPEGAESSKKAAELFFKAYKSHDRKAAARVASEVALKELVWDPAAGNAEGLKLIGPSTIYYVGGSTELTMKKNAQGRWYVSAVKSTAD